MSNFGIIYKITNMVNGKVYTGQTAHTLDERWNQHIRDSRRSSSESRAISRAIRKYGKELFKKEIIETIEIEKLNEREMFWIKEFNSLSFGDGYGYNMTIGGDGVRGRIQTQEEKRKRAEACRGKKRSQKTKDLISAAHIGREITWAHKVSEGMKNFLLENPQEKNKFIERFRTAAQNNKKPVEAFINGIWIEFAGTEDLAKAIGAKAPNITNVIYGKADTVKGFQIRSKNSEIRAIGDKNRSERKSRPHAHKSRFKEIG